MISRYRATVGEQPKTFYLAGAIPGETATAGPVLRDSGAVM